MITTLWQRVGPWLPWLGVLIVLALLVQSVQPAALVVALGHAQLWMLLLVFACGLLALVLRGLRWHLLLQAIAAPNTVLDSIILFTAAQAALLLPGGHFFVPVLQRSEHGTLIRRSAPTVLLQELVYGLLVVPAGLPGVPPYHPAGWMLLMAFVVNVSIGLALVQAWVLGQVLRLGKRLSFIGGHAESLRDLQQHFAMVARSRGAAWGAFLDMGAIALGGLGLYLALLSLGVSQANWIDSTAVYALGSAVGNIAALPAGLGANEAVSTLLLSHMGVATGSAAAGVLLFRVTNLVMGTLIGWIVLLLARRRLKIDPSPGGLARAIRGADLPTGDGRPASSSQVTVDPRIRATWSQQHSGRGGAMSDKVSGAEEGTGPGAARSRGVPTRPVDTPTGRGADDVSSRRRSSGLAAGGPPAPGWQRTEGDSG